MCLVPRPSLESVIQWTVHKRRHQSGGGGLQDDNFTYEPYLVKLMKKGGGWFKNLEKLMLSCMNGPLLR